jgi:hypothetical protein
MAHVWQEGHKASALGSASEITLFLSGHASAAATVHTRVRIDVVFDPQDVFVVNVIDGLGLGFVFHSYISESLFF